MLFITFGHTNRDIWLCRYMPVRMEVVMAEKIVKNYMIILVIQILLTVVILFAASAIIWKCAGDESMVSAVVTGTYIIVSLVGGFTAGKMFEKNRYLWGILAGILYFAVLIQQVQQFLRHLNLRAV